VRIDYTGLDGCDLPLADASCDGALSTFTLCTIEDVDRASPRSGGSCAPGGRFHVLEHGLAPDTGVERWQHRLIPVQRVVAGGCRLDRDIPHLLADAGFEVEEMTSWYLPGPRPWSYTYRGVARAPG
jgi:hypothetical protein